MTAPTPAELAEVLHATNPAHAGCERRYPGGGAYYERWADSILAALAAALTPDPS